MDHLQEAAEIDLGKKMNQKERRETSMSEGLKGINMFNNRLRVK